MGSSGSFVAILLSVPLTVVALVGVVGVPKLQEMLASASSSHDDDGFDPDGFSSRSRSKRPSSKADREKDADPWGDDSAGANALEDEDFGSKPKSSKPKSLASKSKLRPSDDELGSDLEEKPEDGLFRKRSGSGRFGPTPKEPEEIDTVALEPFKAKSPVINADLKTPAPVRGGGNGSFVAAIERLRGMGVERYHLEPGLGAGQFLFVCQVEGHETAPTIHRFEAEAGDPTIAVEDVLKQVASWQSETSVTRTAGAGSRR